MPIRKACSALRVEPVKSIRGRRLKTRSHCQPARLVAIRLVGETNLGHRCRRWDGAGASMRTIPWTPWRMSSVGVASVSRLGTEGPIQRAKRSPAGPSIPAHVLHRVLGVLYRVLGVLHSVLGVLDRVLGVLHRVLGPSIPAHAPPFPGRGTNTTAACVVGTRSLLSGEGGLGGDSRQKASFPA